MRISIVLAVAVLLVNVQRSHGVDFYPIFNATSSTDATDLWPASNLIEGPGVGFDVFEPHDKTAGGAAGSWVTDADAGFPADYIEEVGMPVLTFDLGSDVPLSAISVWGYENNANGVSEFSLTFSTDAEGPGGGSAAAGPFVTLGDRDTGFNDFTLRQNFDFVPLEARYVEMTVIDNFFVAPGDGSNDTLAGGDRAGLGEVAFPTSASARLPILDIDRGTGGMLLNNAEGESVDIAGYNLLSQVGALNGDEWLSIADNYDADSGGSFDPTNNWLVFGNAADDLAEGSLGVATLASSESLNLGNAWFQSPTEDVNLELLLADGSVVRTLVNFFGNDDVPFEVGDLNFDGSIDESDWPIYRDGYGEDLSTLSAAQAYRFGDLNADGVNNSNDFGRFKSAFEAANGAGSFEAMLAGVPEPSSILLLLVPATVVGLRFGRRSLAAAGQLRSPPAITNLASRSTSKLLVAIALALPLVLSGAAQAQNWYPISGTTSSTMDTDLFPVGNLIQGPGIGFDAIAPYDKTSTGAAGNWVTADPAGGVPADYIEDVGMPILTFDLGADLDLNQIDLWGYSSTNANGVKEFSLRFATAAEGLGGFGSSISFNPIFGDVAADETPRQQFPFGEEVTARYVEFTATDNLWAAPGDGSEPGTLPGGDRVGLGEVAFPVVGNAPVLTLQLDPVDGDAQIVNASPFEFEIDLYEILSPGGSLIADGWRSFEDQGTAEFPSGDGSGNGWEELGTPDESLLAEGYLQASSTFSTPSEIYIGEIFSTSEAMDIEFNFRTTDGLLRVGNVNYVNVDPPVGGLNADFNGDNLVDGADQMILQRNFEMGTTQAQGDANGDGMVNGDDQAILDSQFGSAPPPASATTVAVPEPASIGLCLIACVGALGLRHARRGLASALAAGFVCAVAATSAVAASTNDRVYMLGDDPSESAVVGQGVFSSFDSEGGVGLGNLQDLLGFGGATYADVSGRPLAGGSQIGVAFDGVDGFLEGARLGLPSTSEAAIPNGPEDYSGITNRGFQLWVQPASASGPQSIVVDTDQHGLRISAEGNWSMRYNGADFDSSLPVAPGTWVHAMVVRPFGAAAGSSLYIDGVAVSAALGGYNGADDSSLVIGANTDPEFGLVGTEEFFEGVVDDLSMFVLGLNSSQDFGTFNLIEDNEFVADFFQGIPDGDINLDGIVMGDGSGGADDDVAQFVNNWKTRRLVNDIQVGDRISRESGDFNFDGIVSLADWHLLRVNHEDAASLNLGVLLGAAVPEPSTGLAAAIFAGVGLMYRRRFKASRRRMTRSSFKTVVTAVRLIQSAETLASG